MKKQTNEKTKEKFSHQTPKRMNAITDLNWSKIIASDPSTYVDNILLLKINYTVNSSLYVQIHNQKVHD